MFNYRNLSKALRNKDTVQWIKRNNRNYIVSDHFILETNKEVTGTALTTLVKILGGIPQKDQVLTCKFNNKTSSPTKDVTIIELLKIPTDSKTAVLTDLLQRSSLKHQSNKLLSIFKTESDYIFIDKDYVDLIDWKAKDLKIYCENKRVSGIYVTNKSDSILIMPYRLEQKSVYLKD
ncbi:hypothetical protein IMX26_13105 [Clostridium sp. 'deep sea']|uniref:hypothetical protein n=1 Tax=Clostridium sp. 'deep sea' TaxID=2779445 RepID=UPI0018968B4E|nr:hypothetical protein [Clostridium sp. 'deep sea']QOR34424.1 hypothetical protein IMX26_13105 [Clostridium sp. 'deep sea']